MCFEQPANEWISKAQRGFLQGRHMLRNVLDVDFHSLKITLKRARGAIVLFMQWHSLGWLACDGAVFARRSDRSSQDLT